MTHFLTKIIENPTLVNPKDAPDVHRHFTRYSKGQFDGPVIKISTTKTKISVWTSYEYEDVAHKLALDKYPGDPSEEIIIKGSIIGSTNFAPLIEKIGLSSQWNPVKSKGQSVNYSAVNKTDVPVPKDLATQLVNQAANWVSVLFSFTAPDKTVSLKTKIKPPRPSNKNPEDAAQGAKLKFCVLKMPKTAETLEWLINEVASDFKDEIPQEWKSLIVANSYTIEDLVFPSKDQKLSSRAFRLNTLRKGTLNRTCTINNSTDLVNKVNFTA